MNKLITFLIFLIFLCGCSQQPKGTELDTVDKQAAENLYELIKKDYKVNYEIPKIYKKSLKEYEKNCKTNNCEIKGIFENDIIFLDLDWDSSNTLHQSYLLHEFVHYIQHKQKKLNDYITCNERFNVEYEAYTYQYKYLESISAHKFSKEQVLSNILSAFTC
jgi:hypothetical protein